MDGKVVKEVAFWFDVGSPTAYLAWRALTRGFAYPAFKQARVVYRPMLLGGVFKATGNVPPGSVKAKGAWMGSDLALWAKFHDAPLKMNPHFPVNTLTMMRLLTAYHDDAAFPATLDALFRGMWEEERAMGDEAVLTAALEEAGLDAQAALARASAAETKAALIANTEEAVSRGVFGAPTFFVGDAMFFGQDRLHFVRDALAA